MRSVTLPVVVAFAALAGAERTAGLRTVDARVGGAPLPCVQGPCLYAVSEEAGPAQTGDVTAYDAGANGAVPPVRAIAGPKTGLNYPYGIAVGRGRRLYVTNGGGVGFSVTVYGSAADGDMRPMRTIAGSNTALATPLGIALDDDENVYVANLNGGVTVYAAGSNGNVAPLRQIAGSNTGLAGPCSIAVAGGQIFVGNFSGPDGRSSVTVYDQNANGNVAPLRTLSGKRTGLGYPCGIGIGRNGTVYVANELNSVTVYASDARGNAAPLQTISGPDTGMNNCRGLALYDGKIYIANEYAFISQTETVTSYPMSAQGDVAPAQTISDPSGGMRDLWGIAVR